MYYHSDILSNLIDTEKYQWHLVTELLFELRMLRAYIFMWFSDKSCCVKPCYNGLNWTRLNSQPMHTEFSVC